MGLNAIREEFLSFFEGKAHLRLPSFPLIPQGDASLLLINSGMAPLKPYFSGELTPPSKRATTCQKCIRTPDIERVGQTSRHATFFEMLGSFSFGDYFKREAARWAWEFCTETLGMPREKLYVSVYLDDDEAWDIWTNEVGVDAAHMTRLGKADNFWEIGIGPCGPCSEIYFDRGEGYSCGAADCKVGCDCDRYVEFWNLVFTQFHGDGQGQYTPLKQKNIDTGLGLERLACLMQGVDSIFEVDTFRSIREEISAITGVAYHRDEKSDISLRIVTDHIRSTTMMVCDGILPSNEGRGYVLRRLLRRAARHGRLLGVEKPFLFQVCRTVIQNSEAAYPELRARAAHIEQVIRMEEERFEKTLDAGLLLLRESIAAARAASGTDLPGTTLPGAAQPDADLPGTTLPGTTLPGADAFRLYDTFGFPVDLTQEILAEEGMTLDRQAFDDLMQQQRERARQARKSQGDLGWAGMDLGLNRDLATVFLGYDKLASEGRVLALVSGDQLRDSVSEGDPVNIVLDQTPFWAESGGQISDAGRLISEGALVRVDDMRRMKDGKFLHIGFVEAGELSRGDTVKAEVDAGRRAAIARAHSATHLLHSALRQALGNHVQQAGSLVEPDRLRFDFTHHSACTQEQLAMIEHSVNTMALTMTAVDISEMAMDEAKALGATALFGEKYGDLVRVVKMGDLSTELCGGTHLPNTSGIGSFVLRGESSVAAGVRRIEAHVGLRAFEDARADGRTLSDLAQCYKAKPDDLLRRAAQVLSELKDARREMDRLRAANLKAEMDRLCAEARDVAGCKLITVVMPETAPGDLRQAGDFLREKDPDVVAVLAGTQQNNLTFLAVCGKNAVMRGIRAGDIVRQVSKAAGGSGGGRPDSAMGGGKDISKAEGALALVNGILEKTVGR